MSNPFTSEELQLIQRCVFISLKNDYIYTHWHQLNELPETTQQIELVKASPKSFAILTEKAVRLRQNILRKTLFQLYTKKGKSIE